MFLLTFLVIALGAVAGTYLKRQHFQSTARLLVKLDQRDVRLSQSEVQHDAAMKAAEEAVNTQAELLRSQSSVSAIVERLGPEVLDGPQPATWIGRMASAAAKIITGMPRDMLAAIGLVTKLSPHDAAIEEIRKSLRIDPLRRSQIIEVSFRARTPEAARKVLDSLLSLHLARLAEFNAFSEGYEFYRKQSEQLAQALHASETDFAKFKAKNAVVDLQAEKSMLIQKVERLTSVLEGAYSGGAAVDPSTAIVERETGKDGAEMRGLSTPIADIGANPGNNELSQLLSNLNQIKLEQARRGTLLHKNDPRLQELDNQIALAEGILARQTAKITKLINAYKARLTMLDQIEPEVRRLQRDVATKEENYRTYIKATEDRRISQQEQARVAIIVADKPSLPVAPIFPGRLLILAVGLFFSLVAALALVFLVEWKATLGRRAQEVRPLPLNS